MRNRIRRTRVSVPAPPQRSGTADVLFMRAEGYFQRYGLPAGGSRILVAVSGGPDSVALLSVLKELAEHHEWGLGVGHVNHGLRGQESLDDCAFVRMLATRLELPFHLRSLNPNAPRAERNLQAWARFERYKFLERTAVGSKYSHIALAHQLDDRAETMVAAVLDAAGTFALSGIPPVRGKIIRPLFDASRTEILDFLGSRDIAYRVDSSNASTKYQRNRIRRDVLPAWRSENASILEGLARLGEQLWIQRRFLEEQAQKLVDLAMESKSSAGMSLSAHLLLSHDRALDPFILRELTSRLGLDMVPSAASTERFSELRSKAGQGGDFCVEQGELAIGYSQGKLRVYKKRGRSRNTLPEIADQNIPKLETCIVPTPAKLRSDDKVLARFDLDSVQGELSVRWPRPGDRYRPIGLQGTKKLSDLLADRKVPSFERPLVPVVVDDQGILWPIGHPIAHRARLTNRTRRVMEARLQEGSWKSRS